MFVGSNLEILFVSVLLNFHCSRKISLTSVILVPQSILCFLLTEKFLVSNVCLLRSITRPTAGFRIYTNTETMLWVGGFQTPFSSSYTQSSQIVSFKCWTWISNVCTNVIICRYTYSFLSLTKWKFNMDRPPFAYFTIVYRRNHRITQEIWYSD
jgi:hypothetical protein